MFSRCERLEVRADGGAAVGEMAMEEDTDAPTAAEAQAQQVQSSAQQKGIRSNLTCCALAPLPGGVALCRQRATLLSQSEIVQKSSVPSVMANSQGANAMLVS